MHIDFTQDSGILTARLAGRLDTTTSAAAADTLLAQLAQTPFPVVIDLAETSFISSAGLRVLLKCAKLLKKQERNLALCCATPPNLEVLEISGFLTIMAHCSTVEEARGTVLGAATSS